MANGLRNRLLVPVALRMHRWSERVLGREYLSASPDQATVSPEVNKFQDPGWQRAENENAMLSSRESGPTLDWSSEHSPGPPAHWLELVRQRAPQLLRADYSRSAANVPKNRRTHGRVRRPRPVASSRSVASRRPVLGPNPSVRQKHRRAAPPRPRTSKRRDGGHQPRLVSSRLELEPNSAPAVSDSTDHFVQRRERLRTTLSTPRPVRRVQRLPQIGDRSSRNSSSSGHGRRNSPSYNTHAESRSLRSRLANSEPKHLNRSKRVNARVERNRVKGAPRRSDVFSMTGLRDSPTKEIVATSTGTYAAPWWLAEIGGLEPSRSRTRRMDELIMFAPPQDRWPSLPDEPATPDDDISGALRAWERRCRLDREQQGK